MSKVLQSVDLPNVLGDENASVIDEEYRVLNLLYNNLDSIEQLLGPMLSEKLNK